ncbi:MAG: glutamate--tRNA ligase [Acidimicrobiales bacterium]
MTSPVRVRFAPSPTGYLHVGGARTALFNWLFARRAGGAFVLRIEDTDTARGSEDWVAGILSALTWLGLTWDEGPYRQSERLEHYSEAAAKLAASGNAYYCDCTPESIQARRDGAAGPPGYDSFCRDRGLGPGPGRALRFATPEEGETVVDDVVRGRVVFQNSSIEDFVLAKPSGAPLFVLANAVDDAEMGITHVIRGEEHLPNTPKVLLIGSALGYGALGPGPPPVFAHLGLLVNERRQKLSKRRDPVALEGYREAGYLPEAMVNYLATLGWSPPGVDEVAGVGEMVGGFAIDQVNGSPAFFDVRKLDHFNGMYIRAMTTQAFVEAARPWLEAAPWAARYDEATFERLAPLVQERVTRLSEVPAMVDFAFLESPEVDEGSWAKAMRPPERALELLGSVIEAFSALPEELFVGPQLHETTREIGERLGLKLSRAQAPVRVAVTGRSVGPPLFESMEVLGKPEVLARLAAAAGMLTAGVVTG